MTLSICERSVSYIHMGHRDWAPEELQQELLLVFSGEGTTEGLKRWGGGRVNSICPKVRRGLGGSS